MKSVIVHYQELALKGRNRPWFMRPLERNLQVATGRSGCVAGPHAHGTHRDRARAEARWEDIARAAARPCSVSPTSRAAGRRPSDLDALGAAIVADLGDRSPASFRVAARRPDKRYPDSVAGDRAHSWARASRQARGWAVNLERARADRPRRGPERPRVLLLRQGPGAGGLPVGVSGRVACLMSGGIDSPVAAWRMMRRGCRAQLIHFHGYPFVSRVAGQGARAGPRS